MNSYIVKFEVAVEALNVNDAAILAQSKIWFEEEDGRFCDVYNTNGEKETVKFE